MKTLHSRGHRPLKRVVFKYEPGPVAGPGLSAIRASADLWSEDMAGFAPVFDRIGHQLDAAISGPNLDPYFAANDTQIVVAISDVKWRNAVLFTAYNVHDIEPIIDQAKAALDASVVACESAGFPTVAMDCIAPVWQELSRLARKGVRAGATMFEATPDHQIGSLFACFPHVRRDLQEIANRGAAIPMLAVALNSPGAGRDRRKWKLRAVVFPLPRWALVSGPVAGNA